MGGPTPGRPFSAHHPGERLTIPMPAKVPSPELYSQTAKMEAL
jgi:hypothetical protein